APPRARPRPRRPARPIAPLQLPAPAGAPRRPCTGRALPTDRPITVILDPSITGSGHIAGPEAPWHPRTGGVLVHDCTCRAADPCAPALTAVLSPATDRGAGAERPG